MVEKPVTRRDFLRFAGVATVASVAGCIGGGAQSNNGGDQAGGNSNGESSNGDDHHDNEDHHDEDNHEESSDGHHEHEHDHNDEHEHTIGEPVDSIEVGMLTNGSGSHFLPHIVHIKKGGKVTWKLENGAHDTNAYHPDNNKPLRMPEDAEPWSTEIFSEEGRTFEKTFEKEGIYDYFCTPHESVGMIGRVVVGEPDLHNQPAMEEPSGSLPEGARDMMMEFNNRVNEAFGHTHEDEH